VCLYCRGLELLKSASKYAKNVKAIAVTGSINDTTTGLDIADRTFNSQEWLPVCFTLFSLSSWS
jgi:hypothetical protein